MNDEDTEIQHGYYNSVLHHRTDAIGSEQHNIALSKRRAEAVLEFLTSKHSISKGRLKPRGVGPWSPVASNEDKDGRAQNRRVELVKVVDE